MTDRLRIVVTGAAGMLGRTLLRKLAPTHDVIPATRAEFDITDESAAAAFLAEARPNVVIHAAAWTQVDACEKQPDKAMRVNATGAEIVARQCSRLDARMVQISTDYVFDGQGDRPYRETDPTGPINAYGRSKLAGEQAVQRECANHLILRTAWLYGEQGPSFVHTMCKLGQTEGPAVRVVNDQHGSPTSTDALADHIALLLATDATGIVHLSCEGETTWFGLAQEIWRLWNLPRQLEPCTSAEYPRPAQRPTNSRLAKIRLKNLNFPTMPHWQTALDNFKKPNKPL